MIDVIISIILFVVSLGLLICLHELGHFSMAKLFNVYCREFSIGFGPALLHKRKAGKETYFSIRAIPLGGYVSMYGEEDSIPKEEEANLTKDRSIEGIAKWKKAIVISAGVVVNALLAIVIFSISNLCFPTVQLTNNTKVSINSQAANLGIQNNDSISFINYVIPGEQETVFNVFEGSDAYYYVLNDDVSLQGTDTKYVLTYHFYSEKEDNALYKGLALFVGKENTTDDTYKDVKKQNSDDAFLIPDFTKKFVGDADFSASLSYKREETILTANFDFNVKSGSFKDVGISFPIRKFYKPFNVRFAGIWEDFGDSAVGVAKGIITLFKPGGINQMSGLVGIYSTSSQILSTRSFATYLYLWGFISVNLAIFNLLPFPGLDGWQLLVTVIEGISKKKIPTKFKTIMTLIGFGLLIVLMIAILIVDIGRLI